MHGRNNSFGVFSAVCVLALLGGCQPKNIKPEIPKAERQESLDVKDLQLNRTVGAMADISLPPEIRLRGVGLVAGLYGTGSAECPPAHRAYLEQEILARLGRNKAVNPRDLIGSTDTAVVMLEANIPPAATKGTIADVKVTALSGTQTTSLEAGSLYTADLKIVAQFDRDMRTSRTLAEAQGPIFIDYLSGTPDLKNAWVLGGMQTLEDQQLTMTMLKPDYRLAAIVRNEINQRFGADIANAVSPAVMFLKLPREYTDRPARFMELVRGMYISSDAENQRKIIRALAQNLQSDADKNAAETSLEAIGRPVIEEIAPLVSSQNPDIRFYTAKCMLNLGDDRAFGALREFALDGSSPYHYQAIDIIRRSAKRKDSIILMQRLVCENDFQTKFAAYEHLKRLTDTSVSTMVVGDSFIVDRVLSRGKQFIYAKRRGEPVIVLFGVPMNCSKDIYIESDEGDVFINSTEDNEFLDIMRKHPTRDVLIGPLKCRYEVGEIIKKLGSPPISDKSRGISPGLGLSYGRILPILKKMCLAGVVDAEFIAGENAR